MNTNRFPRPKPLTTWSVFYWFYTCPDYEIEIIDEHAEPRPPRKPGRSAAA